MGAEIDVVGESHYQDALQELCGGRTSDGADHPCVAMLLPEPGNLYDENAVAVVIDSHTVGYLARPMANILHPVLAGWQEANGRSFECEARIIGGWRRGADLGHFGVRLALDVDLLP